MNRYTAVDAQGRKVDILASDKASLLGVSTLSEVVERPVVS